MDSRKIKSQFPVFNCNPSLVYADNAATTQRPAIVIEAIADFERNGVANIHRGLYSLAESATAKYEETRKKIALFINTKADCIAFTKGTTESINIVANGFLKNRLQEDDEVLITAMEHHANLIPWQQVCIEKKALLKIIPIDARGDLDLNSISELISTKTKLIAITSISNALGTINPIKQIIDMAHQKNIPVLVDAAQSVSHLKTDVTQLDVDFLTFSAHKMFGPFGVGVLYTSPKHHRSINPLNFGGGSIKNVTFHETQWMSYPRNLEAGTPNISGVIGLSAAIDFINQFKFDEVSKHNEELGEKFRNGLNSLKDFKIIGDPRQRSGIVSFVHHKIHPHDVASYLASKNIAVRAGHHCTQPLLDSIGVPATVRASFSIYNSEADVDRILDALSEIKKFWS